ncbi:hypothetical protein LC724_01240 [Blautia sp. RD014234]|nr:hypothetical protein [Blautia parvula]
MAGAAAGSSLPDNDFIGAAPSSMLAVVKLKEAKNYLKELFYHTSSNPVYQESDIMMGIRYLLLLSNELQAPLVICIGLGSNQGAHSGQSALASSLTVSANYWGVYSVAAAGNEAGKAHHFFAEAPAPNTSTAVEILVPENTRGFTAELWGAPLKSIRLVLNPLWARSYSGCPPGSIIRIPYSLYWKIQRFLLPRN